MDANKRECQMDDLVRTVIGAAYRVSNVLGCGFMEKVYERALAIEIVRNGHEVKCQVPFDVLYLGQNVGSYMADLVVDQGLIVELKCVDSFCSEHMAQCINYLKASNLRLALLINFQKPRVEWKRVILEK